MGTKMSVRLLANDTQQLVMITENWGSLCLLYRRGA